MPGGHTARRWRYWGFGARSLALTTAECGSLWHACHATAAPSKTALSASTSVLTSHTFCTAQVWTRHFSTQCLRMSLPTHLSLTYRFWLGRELSPSCPSGKSVRLLSPYPALPCGAAAKIRASILPPSYTTTQGLAFLLCFAF